MKIVIVPGINTNLGEGPHVFKPYLEAAGHEVHCIDYYHRWWQVIRRKHKVVLEIAGALEDADIAVCHSNGANYLHKALRLLTRRERSYQVFRLSPALNRSTGVTSNVKRCFVFHTKSDWAVRIASWIPFGHPWGRQGAHGYKGKDERIQNIDRTDIIKRHSDWFKPEFMPWVANEILELIE